MMDQIASTRHREEVFAIFLSCLTMTGGLSAGLGGCVHALDSCLENMQSW